MMNLTSSTVPRVLILVGGFGVVSFGSAQAQTASFERFGDLPGGGFWSWALGVSPDGSVVVGAGTPEGRSFPDEACRWEDGVLTGLGDLAGGTLPFSISEAYGTSDGGSVIVGNSIHNPGTEAFRWENDVMVGLGDFDGGAFFSWATDVSADGSVVVGFSNRAGGAAAFRWTQPERLVPILHTDPDALTFAEAVSPDGSVVVGSFILGNSREAFRWTAEDGLVPLGDLPGGTFSAGHDISADGSVIVGVASSARGLQACRWTDSEGWVPLGSLEGDVVRSSANAVSADGSVIVGSWTIELDRSPFLGVAFIWDAEHGMRDLREVLINDFGLDMAGWNLSRTTGISDDGGTIVGWGKNPDGRTEGWVVRIVHDQDGDGISDSLDACPVENATGLDAD
ncbi:MAG: PEP-CTERM sorting domain-containing protein, partial [Planctomycetes bacterium]|nr:PEP-CTERM sorting domain-containing protein [Planctomycetota bacterium]